MEHLANRIQSCREVRGIKPAALATACGVSENTVRRWERGEVGVPDIQKLRLAGELGVTVEYLMGWDLAEVGAAA